MGAMLNPFTGRLDLVTNLFPNGLYLFSPDGTKWIITIDNSGSLITSSMVGKPIGLLLCLTYSK